MLSERYFDTSRGRARMLALVVPFALFACGNAELGEGSADAAVGGSDGSAASAGQGGTSFGGTSASGGSGLVASGGNSGGGVGGASGAGAIGGGAGAGGGGAGDAAVDGGSCSCGPESCGTRTCGRSPCGYPCGTCLFNEWCAAGKCQAGSGPGTRCSDAFDWYGWGNVWEGDKGLRVCPSDPTKVELCTCGGGGPDAWISCSGSCFTPCRGPEPCGQGLGCGGTVHCGGVECSPLEYCQVCSSGTTSPTYTCRPRDGSNGSCPNAGMVVDAFCDGDNDCASTDQCMAVVGDIVSLRCERDDTTVACGIGAGYYELCHFPGDCSKCSSCGSSTFADWSTYAGMTDGWCR